MCDFHLRSWFSLSPNRRSSLPSTERTHFHHDMRKLWARWLRWMIEKCSYPDSGNPGYQITESTVFQSIGVYRIYSAFIFVWSCLFSYLIIYKTWKLSFNNIMTELTLKQRMKGMKRWFRFVYDPVRIFFSELIVKIFLLISMYMIVFRRVS